MKPLNQSIEEFYKHQEVLLPYTSSYIGKKNLDIGCGSGITSLIFQEKLGVSPTLCDTRDIRHELAKVFPFSLITDESLPFVDKVFDSSYLQYVLHHVSGEEGVGHLLAEAARVAGKVIVVEEVMGEKTDIAQAKKFDEDVNDHLHPETPMPIYRYYSAAEIEGYFKKIGLKTVLHQVVSSGSIENGFLETHVFVGEKIR